MPLIDASGRSFSGLAGATRQLRIFCGPDHMHLLMPKEWRELLFECYIGIEFTPSCGSRLHRLAAFAPPSRQQSSATVPRSLLGAAESSVDYGSGACMLPLHPSPQSRLLFAAFGE